MWLMEDLVTLLQRCEDDTRRQLGHLAAQRLGNWRKHASSQTALIEYVERLLWGEHCANGRKLDEQGGLSLERIVSIICLLYSPNLIENRRSERYWESDDAAPCEMPKGEYAMSLRNRFLQLEESGGNAW
jgi:hypothetical protein